MTNKLYVIAHNNKFFIAQPTNKCGWKDMKSSKFPYLGDGYMKHVNKELDDADKCASLEEFLDNKVIPSNNFVKRLDENNLDPINTLMLHIISKVAKKEGSNYTEAIYSLPFDDVIGSAERIYKLN